jgi:hypothetical protein
MSFLEDYDRIDAADAKARMAVTLHWLRADWRNLFKELRAKRPVFRSPLITFVVRRGDVL